MERLPFNPGHAAGAQPEHSRTARREQQQFSSVVEAAQLTVSQACELIKSTLESRVPSALRVVGQVSNLRADSHWYFTLKDATAVLHCVAWATNARKFAFKPVDGDEIVATGHISHYAPQGRTQLYVSALQPVGAGALELKFRAMCEELRSLGYFEESRKRRLPLLPRRIAVITSAGGAAIHDVLDTARRRCTAVCLLIIDVRVQGEGAADQVARAIRWVDANHDRLGIDAMLVTRGGGSIEDLWAFNERVVADATFNSSISIVAAIGHESDTTVIELVADMRAATPTQAAMRLIPAADELQVIVRHHEDRMALLVRRCAERANQRLTSLLRHELFRDPLGPCRRAADLILTAERRLAQSLRLSLMARRARLDAIAAAFAEYQPRALTAARMSRLAVLADRLDRSIRSSLQRLRENHHVRRQMLHSASARLIHTTQERLLALQRNLDIINPHSVLGRGYSYTQDDRGLLIRSIRDVRSGQRITTRLSDGSIESIVGASRPRRQRDAGAAPSQMDLFDRLQ